MYIWPDMHATPELDMNVTLTLPPLVALWAEEQPDAEAAIQQVLSAHVEAHQSPMSRAWRDFVQKIPGLPYDHEFMVKHVVGETLWNPLIRKERVAMGKRVSREVKALGLIALNPPGDARGRYRRARPEELEE